MFATILAFVLRIFIEYTSNLILDGNFQILDSINGQNADDINDHVLFDSIQFDTFKFATNG